MRFEIQRVDTQTASESLLRELSRYYELIEAENIPRDPPTPVERRVAEWRQMTAFHPEFHWILRDDDGIAAAAVADYDVEQNLENGFGRIHVHPDKRGRGYGRVLATPMLDLLEENGRTRFGTLVNKADKAEALASRLGLKRVYEDKRSRLNISDIDLDLMDIWAERALERAGDYELVYFESPIPVEVVEKFCEVTAIMNTAPREDYEEEDEVLTPQRWDQLESCVLGAKGQLHHLIAVHKPTGDFAGYTQIQTQGLQPDLAWQWDTGVDPGHRNKGLGRWLKAEMIRRVTASHRQVTRIDTFNAGSNEPMLAINVEMGFRPIHIAYDWQGNLATVRERLGA